jgi:uncharacterized metal-binding protein YceD (DUF177 family)
MTKHEFTVRLADLERGAKRITWPITEHWLRLALADTEAAPRGGDGVLDLELTKSGSQVMVRGAAEVALTMPCARTLDPVAVDVRPEIFLLLSPAKAAANVVRPRRSRNRRPEPGRVVAMSERVSKRRAARVIEEAELGTEDAAQDTYHGEEIVLDDFVREFILLDLPMFPVREDLRSNQDPAIAPRAPDSEPERPIDPRLMPLAELASRLRGQKE